MLQQLLLHVAYILHVRVASARRHAHPVAQILRGQALGKLEQRPKRDADVVQCYWAHRVAVPFTCSGVEPHLGNLGPVLVPVNLKAEALAARQADI